MMKPSWGIVAVCLFIGCSAFAQESISIAPADDRVVDSVYALELLYINQVYQYLPVSPPMEEVFVQSLEEAVPVLWKNFPSEFTKQMYAEMNANGLPLYRVSVYEDPASRETVFLNMYGKEAFRLEPENGYDPYAWQKVKFGEESFLARDELNRWIFDPAHIAVELTLVPEVFYTAYLEDQEAEALVPEAMPMMMAMGASGISKPMAHMVQGTNGIVLEISLPVDFGRYAEVFRRENLESSYWEVADSWLPTFSRTNMVWVDGISTNKCFYHISNAFDSDGDGYSNLREAWFEGTDSNSFDFVNDDGDSMHDWWERVIFGHTNQTDITDSDQDGLLDCEELIYVPGASTKITLVSDPSLYDTDADGLNDYDEVNGSPPTNPWDPDTSAPSVNVGSPASGTTISP